MEKIDEPMLKQIEAAVLEIWKQELEQDCIEIEDNFFDIGGDSISMMKIVFRIREDLGADLNPGIMFDTPDIRGLSQLILATTRSENLA
jgi:acyl carrier protein